MDGNGMEQKATDRKEGHESSSLQAMYFKIFGLSGLLYAAVYTICMFQNDSGITMPVWIAATILYACVTMRQISVAESVKEKELIREEMAGKEAARAEVAEKEPIRVDMVGKEPIRTDVAEKEPNRADMVGKEPIRAEVAEKEPIRAEKEWIRADVAEKEPIRAEMAEKEWIRADVAEKELIRAETAGKEPIRADVAEKEPIRAEMAEKESTRTDVAEKELIRAETAGKEAARADMAQKEPAKADAAERDMTRADTGTNVSAGSYGHLRTGSWFYITVMMLLGIATFLTDQAIMIWMNYIGFFVMLLLFLLHNFYDDSQWDFTKNMVAMMTAVSGAVGCALTPFTDGYAFLREKKTKENKTTRAVLTGLLLAAPGILVVGFCLMCADAVFETMVLRMFSGVRMPVRVLQAVGMLLFGFFSSYCGMRYLIRRVQIQIECRRPVFDPVIAITFLAPFFIMYAVFCGVQVLYLFAASMQLPDGMTYAQYAHRGFYMLLFVCVVNFGLVLVMRKYFARNRILHMLLLLICGCTFVMLASSAYRMCMYISVYQLTFLRVFVLAALLALAFLLAGAIAVILKPNFMLVRYSIGVISTIYLCLAFVHVDHLIASYNLAHAQENAANMDWWYLSQLSLDAAPAVEHYYEQASLEAKRQMDDGARLAQAILEGRLDDSMLAETDAPKETYWYSMYMCKVYQAKSNLGVRNFNLSRYRAVQMLAGK